MPTEDIVQLEQIAKRVRRTIIEMSYRTRSPHLASSLSCVEILVALYFKILEIIPENRIEIDRDRFILSKGHACPALYAVLSEKGILGRDILSCFAIDGGVLEQHPNMDLSIGIEVSTGTLGHGLSIGAGMSLASRIDKQSKKIYVLLSDGELNEGSVWEAVMFAGHHGLANLVALVDANKMQALGHTREIIDLEPIADKWRQFGWHAQELDGHDFRQILTALNSLAAGKPNVVVLNTVKGKGVSFMEDNLLWHYRAPNDEEYELALKELYS